MAERFLPWSDTCFVCGEANRAGLGVRFVVDGDTVVVRTVLDPCYEGYPGHVHGGIITALLDETMGWACTVATGRLCLTAEINVRFRRPVPAGRDLVVKGRSQASSDRVARGHGWIEDGGGTVLATAEGVFFPLPEARHQEVVPMLKMAGRAARLDDI
jgi:uncharacterized protein (TIGR00369 family)